MRVAEATEAHLAQHPAAGPGHAWGSGERVLNRTMQRVILLWSPVSVAQGLPKLSMGYLIVLDGCFYL